MKSITAFTSLHVRSTIQLLIVLICLSEIRAQCVIQNQPTSPAPICAGGVTADVNVFSSGCTLIQNIQWQYSPDGSVWSNTTNGYPAAAVYSNPNSNLGFHVSGISSAGTYHYRCLLSEDTGLNHWTIQRSAADEAWQSVAYGNGLYVAVARKTQRLMSSPDGIQWTVRNHNCGRADWNDITYGNGLFVAVAGNAGVNNVMSSPDGLNWTTRIGASSNSFQSIAYGNGLFVAVASGGNSAHRIMTSADGINWSSQVSPGGSAYSWKGVCYGNGLFVAVSSSGGANRIMTSADGVQWTAQSCPANYAWYSVAYGNGLFVAVSITGNGRRVMTSSDGIQWTLRNSAANLDWYDVTFGNGKFVAVASSGQGNRVMSSLNGIDWVSEISAADNNWRALCFANGRFVAVSTSGSGDRVMTSSLLVSSVVSVRVMAPLTLIVRSNSAEVCLNSLMNQVSHLSSGATGIGLPVGLPDGISAYWAADSILLSGTALVPGSFPYQIPLTGGCGNTIATGVILVKAPPAPLVLDQQMSCSVSSGSLYSEASETNVRYQLYDASQDALGLPITGNGGSLSWLNIPRGSGYQVLGTDSVGCSSVSNSVEVVLSAINLSISSKTDSLCYFEHNGSAQISLSGGFAPFLSDWLDLPGQNDQLQRTGLDTGSYLLVVTDSIGCKDSLRISIAAYSNCYEWISTGTTDWNTAGNWLQGVVPPEDSRIAIGAQASMDIQINQMHSIQHLYFNHRSIKVLPGNFDLKISRGWSGDDSSSFFSTRGTGRLCYTLAAESSKKFPVGRSSYNPVNLTNHTESADEFCVAVLDEMYSEGSSGLVLDMYPRLRRTWLINKGSGGSNSGSGVDFTFYWNVNEDTLNPLAYNLSRFNGSMWTDLPGTSVVHERSLSYYGYMGDFSMFGIYGNFPLPVSWLYINAICDQDSAILEWATASELNNRCFVAEGSDDGKTWKEVAKTLASRSLSSVHKYSMELSAALPYVRLRQQDFDGNFSYSDIMQIPCSIKSSDIIVYPNPSSGTFRLKGNIRLRDFALYNSVGQLVMQSQSTDLNNFSLDLSAMKKGVYTLRLKTDSEEFSKRLILH